MPPSPLSPAQAAALRRARELAAELTQLTATVRGAIAPAADPVPAPAAVPTPAADEPGLAAGELGAAFAAARRGSRRRGPRELFGR